MNTDMKNQGLNGRACSPLRAGRFLQPGGAHGVTRPTLVLFAILYLLSSILVFSQTPVTLSTVNTYGAQPNATVTFTPAQQIGVSYPDYVLGGPFSVTATNGAVTTNLLEGPYVISFSGLVASRTVYVPGLWITNCGYTLPVNLAAPQWQLPPGVTRIVLTNFTGSIVSVVLTNSATNAILGGTLLLNTNYDAYGSAAAVQSTSDTNGAAMWALAQAKTFTSLYSNQVTPQSISNNLPAQVVTNGQPVALATNAQSATYAGTATNAQAAAFASLASTATNAPNGTALSSLMTTNDAGTFYQDTNALYFANRNQITSITARNQLVMMQNILNQYGIVSNITDVLLFNPLFNPTNAISYYGRAIHESGITYPDTFGAYFTNGAFAELDNLPNDYRTGCVMVVYARPGYNGADGGDLANNTDALFGFYNTNTLSGEWVAGSQNEMHIASREGTNLWNSIMNGNFPSETNLIYTTTWAGGNSLYPNASSAGYNIYNKSMWTYSWSGTNQTCWNRGNQGQFNAYGQVYTLGAPNPAQEALTTFRVGSDVMTGNQSGVFPMSGSIQAVFLCNCAANSNLVKALNLAAWAISPETKDVVFVTHSRGVWGGGGNWDSRTNSYEYYMVPQFTQVPFSYEMYPIASTALYSSWGNTMSNYLFNLGPLPPNVQRIIIEDFGVNDIYLGGYTPAQFMGALQSFAFAAHTNSCLFYPMTDFGAGSNATAVTYSSANNTLVWQEDQLIFSNGYCWDGIYDMGRLANARILQTNLNYTGDGLHFNGVATWATNAYEFQMLVPGTLVHGRTAQPDFDGNVPTNYLQQPW